MKQKHKFRITYYISTCDCDYTWHFNEETRQFDDIICTHKNKVRMKISNLLSDQERHYLSNLLRSGAGEVADENGNISPTATHRFVIENGFVIGAVRVIGEENSHGIRNKTE